MLINRTKSKHNVSSYLSWDSVYSLCVSPFQLRNTLRFLLGNLQGFDPRTQAVDPKEMYFIDQYLLHLLRDYSMKVNVFLL